MKKISSLSIPLYGNIVEKIVETIINYCFTYNKDFFNFNPKISKNLPKTFYQIINIKNFYGYPNVDKKTILKLIYRGYRKTGFEGKWFFIKKFGFLNYLKVKTW